MIYGDRTIVTEVRTRVVNAKGKEATYRSNNSVRAQEVTQEHFKVTPEEYKVIEGFGTFFKLETEHPVILSMTQGNGVQHPTVEKDEYVTHDAVITTEFVEDITLSMSIKLVDPDILGSEYVIVTAFNTVSGETEYVKLYRVAAGVYMGSLDLEFSALKGGDFDGLMSYYYDTPIRISMVDHLTAEGKRKTITSEKVYPVPLLFPLLYVRKPSNESVQICIKNLPEDTPVLSVDGNEVPVILDEKGIMSVSLDDNAPDINSVEFSFFINDEKYFITKNVKEINEAPTLFITENVLDSGIVNVTVKDVFNFEDSVSVMVFSEADNRSLELQSVDGTGTFSSTFQVSGFDYEKDYTIGVSYSYTMEGTLNILKAYSNVYVDSKSNEEPKLPKPIEIYVDGCFVLNGSFDGSITIKPAKLEEISCSCVIAR